MRYTHCQKIGKSNNIKVLESLKAKGNRTFKIGEGQLWLGKENKDVDIKLSAHDAFLE